jgi:arylsulfatase A-like enzyme
MNHINSKFSRRWFMGLAGLGVFSLTACSRSLNHPAMVQRRQNKMLRKTYPNVIVILSDDLGYGDLSCNGHPFLKTPNIDNFFKDSVSFSDYHASTVCAPSRSQLLSGQDAMRNGAFGNQYTREMMRLDVPTMAEIFKANGYCTAMFGKWHQGENYPYRPQDRGFDEVVTFGGAHIAQTPDYWDNDYWDDIYSHNGEREKFEGYCDDIWFDKTIEFSHMCNETDKPFFIYLPTNVPHGPYFSPRCDRTPYDGKVKYVTQAGFLGMIARHDKNIGRLDKYLKKNSLYENTIVIWFGDNGTSGGEKIYNAGMRGHKRSYYEGGHRVACAIRWPKGNIAGGHVIDGLAQNQDWLPTLINLCGLNNTLDAKFDGIDISTALQRNQHLPERIIIVQVSETGIVPVKWKCAVLWNKWRLVHGEELYDLESDPGQKNDIASQNLQVVKRLRDYYEKWWNDVEPLTRDEIAMPLYVGSEYENPVCLTLFDWFGSKGSGAVTLQKSVRQGRPLFGYWNLQICRSGKYKVRVRRWPEEVDTPIREGLPKYLPPHNQEEEELHCLYPIGKALPIAKVMIRLNDEERIAVISEWDKDVSFDFNLPVGKATLQGWFLGEDNKKICGTYYAYVEFLGRGK